MILDNNPRQLLRPIPGHMDSINALKFICAIMVVGIHVHSVFSEYFLHIFRGAVPSFLFVSGYFLVNSDGTISISKTG